jgi:hypothetical protein
MATTAQAPYTLLVANFSRPTQSLETGSDTSEMPPTKTRTGFQFQPIQNIGLATDHTNATAVPARSLITDTLLATMQPLDPNARPGATLTVASDVFVGHSASVFVGEFELVSDRDFVTGGGAAATATALAAAISALPGYDGTPAGADVTVLGPRGQLRLNLDAAYRGGELNFTFAYLDTTQEGLLGFGVGVKPEEPPVILPPGLPNGVAP